MSISRFFEWIVDSAWEPTDCETCGTSYEAVTVSWGGHWFAAHYSIGCYGGGGDSRMNLEQLTDWVGKLPDGFITAADERELLAAAEREWDSNNPSK